MAPGGTFHPQSGGNPLTVGSTGTSVTIDSLARSSANVPCAEHSPAAAGVARQPAGQPVGRPISASSRATSAA